MGQTPSEQELKAACCWEADDRVPGRPAMTAFRRAFRFHQAQWREAHGHPTGTQPIVPKPGGGSVRPVGSRLPLAYARDSGATFVTANARAAAAARTSTIESHQSFDHQRLWAELLWSPTLAFNLFGDLWADAARADRAVHTWWPDVPGVVSAVRFAHSPGRLDLAFIGSLVDFDAAFELELADGTSGVVAFDVRCHDKLQRAVPKPIRMWRYVEVFERSGVFKTDALAAVNGTLLTVTWLEHLLLLSMLQHPSGRWTWGRYVVVHPSGNSDFAEACAQYRELLVDPSTFASVTIEELLDSGVLAAPSVVALRERYVPADDPPAG